MARLCLEYETPARGTVVSPVPSLRAQRSNPSRRRESIDCFVDSAPRRNRHTPRKRSIQYAAASRLYHWCLGILDRPPSRAMTAVSVAGSYSSDVTAPSRREAPAALIYLPPKEGVGNAGCPLHPRPPVHLVVVERTPVYENTGMTRRSRTQSV